MTAGSVSFAPAGGPGNSAGRQYASAIISPDGTYTASGLSIGDYTVRVTGPNVMQYQTKYTAAASGTFDIDIHGRVVRGRVVDARSGAALADARVSMTSRAPANGSALTDSDGRFAIDALPDSTYDLQVNREQYAASSQQVVIANGSAPDIEVRMEPAPAVTIHVTDSATGGPVDANVIISNSSASFRGEAIRVENGTFRAWLKPGTYTAAAYLRGYVYKSQSFTTPGDVAIALVRSGALVIRARTAQRAQISGPSSDVVRPLGTLHPGVNGPFELTPGPLTLALIGSDGKETQSIPLLINSGETTTIDVP
jgi:hypothetical protein